ncbi:hypothetical protein RV040_004115 [Vibrio alginolyticus]|nr:hypothetical protein [Vibrio alginolyticus]
MISLHYVFARVGERAHADVLPLCCYHHVTRLEAEKLTQYPNMIPIHAKGKYGGKAQWKIHKGTETELLFKVYILAGLTLELRKRNHPNNSEHTPIQTIFLAIKS